MNQPNKLWLARGSPHTRERSDGGAPIRLSNVHDSHNNDLRIGNCNGI